MYVKDKSRAGCFSRASSNSIETLTKAEASSLISYKKQKCKKSTKHAFLSFALIVFTSFTIIWVLIPVSFLLSLNFQTFMVFIPINAPANVDFSRPQDLGLRGIYNHYLETQDYHDKTTWTSIGLWLVLHEQDINKTTTSNVEQLLNETDKDILIYLHGVLSNRARATEQYRVLRKHFIIVAVDHRGYGDSGKNVRMSEQGMAYDHLQIYEWIRKVNTKKDIYYWGHSMGSGISATTVNWLKERRNEVPKGLVLESPFTTLRDVVRNTVIGKMFAWLPYFESTILQPLSDNGLLFETEVNMRRINCPVMIMHAEDDPVIPYFLGERLAKNSIRENWQGNVTFHGISAKLGLGHANIIHHSDMDTFIEDFKIECRSFQR
ncbi:lysophosphatidylserine lipase ABHD12-like [Anthonomus grandis grandis]|uniref:lysophosphatidylserine lipase ABHD12-like n=1 Tax=Anthonomus grandis grandis TaxID=2921223 RepID=UPI0021652914|nr:lysophosphatidylserine lipase ABHD12-like [Anthonomus grandis grandis]